MKLFLLFILCLQLNASTDTKIIKIKKNIHKIEKTYKINRERFKKLAIGILKQRKKLNKIKRNLRRLSYRRENKRREIKRREIKQKVLLKNKNSTLKQIDYIQSQTFALISQKLSLLLTLNKKAPQNKNDVIEEYIFKRYIQISDEQLKYLLRVLNNKINEIRNYEGQLGKIENDIYKLSAQIQEKTKLKKKQEKNIKKIRVQLEKYNKKIRKINRSKKYLSSLLYKLNIRKKRDKKRKERLRLQKQKQERIFQKQMQKDTSPALNSNKLEINEPDIKIRKIQSSYIKEKTARYRGKKTISPIKYFKIIETFGKKYDKVYNIYTFNRSIILKSLKKKQKVRSVLSGKVIFADDTPTLNKTIIIKHKNNIHTIYANLSQISPIHSGQWIKKGSIIGRVSDELTFEVLKGDRYINPISFIKIK